MPWASVLKLLLEITMVGLEKDPETYFDYSITYDKKRKSEDHHKVLKKLQATQNYNSDDDFEDTTKHKVKKSKITAAVIENSVIQPVNTKGTNAVTVPTRQSVIKHPENQNETAVVVDEESVSIVVIEESDTAVVFAAETATEDQEPVTPPANTNREQTRQKIISMKLPSPKPTSKCFSRWKNLDSDETLSTYKPNCLVQVIAINSTTRHAPCNIRLSDGLHWLDTDIADNLRIHFNKNMVVENDILMLKKTIGNLHEKNFEILAFVRPEWAQVGRVRHGNPLPLMENTIVSYRKVPQVKIVPLVSSFGSFDEEEFDNLLLENNGNMSRYLMMKIVELKIMM